jgi:predicted peptidase
MLYYIAAKRFRIVLRRQMLYKFFLLITIAVIVATITIIVILPAMSQVAKRSPAQTMPKHPSVPITYGYSRQLFTNAQGQSLVYYLYLPRNYNPHKEYPLVLLLHGDGEKINPQKTQAQNETALLRNWYVRVWTAGYTAPNNPEIQQHWPSFIVVPQITDSEKWIDGAVHKGYDVQTKQPSTALFLTMQLLNALPYKYPDIDASRRYITGISSGAYGVWDAIERWPTYFAAAAPIAGLGNPLKAALLTHLPIWVFHGSSDHSVDVSGSRNMVKAIRAAGGKPRYTEFRNLGHGTWADAYSLPGAPQPVAGFFPWFFSQKK